VDYAECTSIKIILPATIKLRIPITISNLTLTDISSLFHDSYKSKTSNTYVIFDLMTLKHLL
jgi:hypothetical protein